MANTTRKPPAKPKPVSTNGHHKRTALIAAATNIKLDDRKEAQRAQRRRAEWQRDAWDYYDLIGEAKYGINVLGNHISKLYVYPAVRGTDSRLEPEQTDDKEAVAATERIFGRQQADAGDILRDTAINFQVAGECYLVGREQDQKEDWGIYSIDEVTYKGSEWQVKGAPVEKGTEVGGETAMLVRLWLRHARYSDLADSPLRGVLSSCEQIILFERERRALSRSRIAQSGILLIPDELDFGPSGDGETDDSPFMSDLADTMEASIREEGVASAVVPASVTGKAQYLKEFRHLSMDRPQSENFDRDLERAIRRLAQGLNIPVEVIMGIADINHWGAWAVQDDTFKIHVEPLAIQILNSLTVGYLWPVLEAANVADPQQYVFWYDASRIINRPNRANDGKWAHENLIVSDEAQRHILGFDDNDAPSDDEIMRRLAARRGGSDAWLAEALLRLIDPELKVLRPISSGQEIVETSGGGSEPVSQTGQETGPPTTVPSSGQASPTLTAAATRRNLGTRLAEIDRGLRDRLAIACDRAIRRALERLGAKLRSRVQKDTNLKEVIRGAANEHVARLLGSPVVTAAVSLDSELEDMFAGTIADFEQWTAAAQAQALDSISPLSDSEKDAIQAKQEQELHEASAWLLAALVALASVQLFAGDSDPTLGEFDTSLLVPAGLIREAVARAGGTLTIDSQGAYSAVSTQGTPLGGIGTGETIQQLLRDKGWGVEAYEWEYGSYPRKSFEPHRNLDGAVFQNFDDPILANTEGFPPFPYYLPGDHSGCVCTAVPVLVAPSVFPEPVVD